VAGDEGRGGAIEVSKTTVPASSTILALGLRDEPELGRPLATDAVLVVAARGWLLGPSQTRIRRLKTVVGFWRVRSRRRLNRRPSPGLAFAPSGDDKNRRRFLLQFTNGGGSLTMERHLVPQRNR
jgi:hypothetical protein